MAGHQQGLAFGTYTHNNNNNTARRLGNARHLADSSLLSWFSTAPLASFSTSSDPVCFRRHPRTEEEGLYSYPRIRHNATALEKLRSDPDVLFILD
eukprot:3403218-Rhodomonas_salina.1